MPLPRGSEQRRSPSAHRPRDRRWACSTGLGLSARLRAVSAPPRSPSVSQVVNFVNVSTAGLESSPVAEALAGLRANEARYFKNKYDQDFATEPASKAKKLVD